MTMHPVVEAGPGLQDLHVKIGTLAALIGSLSMWAVLHRGWACNPLYRDYLSRFDPLLTMPDPSHVSTALTSNRQDASYWESRYSHTHFVRGRG
jgi:hypothetical protein